VKYLSRQTKCKSHILIISKSEIASVIIAQSLLANESSTWSEHTQLNVPSTTSPTINTFANWFIMEQAFLQKSNNSAKYFYHCLSNKECKSQKIINCDYSSQFYNISEHRFHFPENSNSILVDYVLHLTCNVKKSNSKRRILLELPMLIGFID